MKKQSNTLMNLLSEASMASLTREVKETIAFGLAEPAPRPRVFTVADLWDIQRRGKANMQRRFL